MKVILLKGTDSNHLEDLMKDLEKPFENLEKALDDFENTIEEETHGKSGVVVICGKKIVKFFGKNSKD